MRFSIVAGLVGIACLCSPAVHADVHAESACAGSYEKAECIDGETYEVLLGEDNKPMTVVTAAPPRSDPASGAQKRPCLLVVHPPGGNCVELLGGASASERAKERQADHCAIRIIVPAGKDVASRSSDLQCAGHLQQQIRGLLADTLDDRISCEAGQLSTCQDLDTHLNTLGFVSKMQSNLIANVFSDTPVALTPNNTEIRTSGASIEGEIRSLFVDKDAQERESAAQSLFRRMDGSAPLYFDNRVTLCPPSGCVKPVESPMVGPETGVSSGYAVALPSTFSAAGVLSRDQAVASDADVAAMLPPVPAYPSSPPASLQSPVIVEHSPLFDIMQPAREIGDGSWGSPLMVVPIPPIESPRPESLALAADPSPAPDQTVEQGPLPRSPSDDGPVPTPVVQRPTPAPDDSSARGLPFPAADPRVSDLTHASRPSAGMTDQGGMLSPIFPFALLQIARQMGFGPGIVSSMGSSRGLLGMFSGGLSLLSSMLTQGAAPNVPSSYSYQNPLPQSVLNVFWMDSHVVAGTAPVVSWSIGTATACRVEAFRTYGSVVLAPMLAQDGLPAQGSLALPIIRAGESFAATVTCSSPQGSLSRTVLISDEEQ